MRARCLLISVFLFGVEAAFSQQELPAYGVLEKLDGVAPGYTLLSPLSSQVTYLINNDGMVVHEWHTNAKPGQSSYLLEDGSLLRAAKTDTFYQFPETTGSGGQIQKYDWEGNLIWDFKASSAYRMSHHDVEPMPNGNVLLIVWESYLRRVAEQAGRNPDLLQGSVLWFEAIFEIKPNGLHGGDIVWKWSLLDHIVQDYNPDADNYADPAAHPELVNINFMIRSRPDWIHMNSVSYHPTLDQIMLGSRSFNEIWIIDHSTSTEEAAGHVGGRSGRGGDLLYRWGNPITYRRGGTEDRKLFNQHDAHWIAEGLPGAGNVLLFNNGSLNSAHDFSSVGELSLPLQPDGSYALEADKPFGPDDWTWTYQNRADLFSPRISGAQRLPNGNTLICSGTQGYLMEVTSEGQRVWLYRNPLRFQVPDSGDRAPKQDQTEKKKYGGLRDKTFKGSIARLPPDQLETLRIPGGVPLEEGGTLFRALKYSPDYPAFIGRDLSAKPTKRPGPQEE